MILSHDFADSVFDDDAPDMSTPYWQKRIAQAVVSRGRPRAERLKAVHHAGRDTHRAHQA